MEKFKSLFLIIALMALWLIAGNVGADEGFRPDVKKEEKITDKAERVAEELRHEIENEIANLIGPDISDWEISELNIPDSGRLPSEFDEFTIIPSKRGIIGNRVSLGVQFSKNGRLIKRLNVHGRITAYADVVVPQENLERGTPISIGQVTVKRMPVTLPLNDFCMDVAMVEGMTAERRLKQGNAIKKSELSRTPDIMAGEAVVIVAENFNVKITARGVARENGALGDVISVLNTQSNKQVLARVTGGSTVQVVF